LFRGADIIGEKEENMELIAEAVIDAGRSIAAAIAIAAMLRTVFPRKKRRKA